LMSPEMRTYAHFEHVLAFALLGALFAYAYPHKLLLVCSVVLGGAVLLELAQTMTPDRHGTLIDALEKMAGGAAGILVASTARRLWSAKDRPS
jgi:VanZ family protein